MSQDDPLQGMGDDPGYQGEVEPEVESSSPAQPEEVGGPSEGSGQERWPELVGVEVKGLKRELEQYQENWPELAGEEVESLKLELEQYQRELDAIHERVESVKRESKARAEAIRREGEAKAKEILRKAKAEADLLELRTRVRAEEIRAREVARLWTRLDSLLSAGGEGEYAVGLSQEAPAAAKEEPEEAVPAAEMAEEAVELEVGPAVAEEAEPVEEEVTVEESQPVEEEAAVEEFQPGEEATEEFQPGAEAAVEEFQPVEEEAAAEEEEASAESVSGVAEAVPAEGQPAPDFAAQPSPEVHRYKVRGPLSFGSMVAIEQAAGRIPQVLSAKVSPSPDGGAVLTVSTLDPDVMEQGLREIPHLSWQLEEL